MMHARRTIVAACLLALIQFAPTVASAARSCITTVAGDTCLATCIGNLQEVCGSDAACHQEIAAALQILASTKADTLICEGAVENAKAVCGCE
jgi:hypothetical protein